MVTNRPIGTNYLKNGIFHHGPIASRAIVAKNYNIFVIPQLTPSERQQKIFTKNIFWGNIFGKNMMEEDQVDENVLPANIRESETGKSIETIAKCLAMNTDHGVDMAAHMLSNTKWRSMPFFGEKSVNVELAKASYVISKLAVTFEKVNVVDQSKYEKSFLRNMLENFIFKKKKCGKFSA